MVLLMGEKWIALLAYHLGRLLAKGLRQLILVRRLGNAAVSGIVDCEEMRVVMCRSEAKGRTDGDDGKLELPTGWLFSG